MSANEPAFPMAPVGTGDPRDGMAGGAVGLSKLELFTAMAMQGLCADPNTYPGNIPEMAVNIASRTLKKLAVLREREGKP